MKADAAAFAAFPELRRLAELRDRGGWMFRPVSLDGDVDLLTGARVWPDGWSDALAIRDRCDAKAFRCDAAGGEVWQREGTMRDVLDGLLELPPPDAPGAPRLVIASRLWRI